MGIIFPYSFPAKHQEVILSMATKFVHDLKHLKYLQPSHNHL